MNVAEKGYKCFECKNVRKSGGRGDLENLMRWRATGLRSECTSKDIRVCLARMSRDNFRLNSSRVCPRTGTRSGRIRLPWPTSTKLYNCKLLSRLTRAAIFVASGHMAVEPVSRDVSRARLGPPSLSTEPTIRKKVRNQLNRGQSWPILVKWRIDRSKLNCRSRVLCSFQLQRVYIVFEAGAYLRFEKNKGKEYMNVGQREDRTKTRTGTGKYVTHTQLKIILRITNLYRCIYEPRYTTSQ